MRGLTDAEYATLHLIATDRDMVLDWGDDIDQACEAEVTARRARAYWDGEFWVFQLTPLGRLALSLWPAIRCQS